jgi:hypothetical protein
MKTCEALAKLTIDTSFLRVILFNIAHLDGGSSGIHAEEKTPPREWRLGVVETAVSRQDAAGPSSRRASGRRRAGD